MLRFRLGTPHLALSTLVLAAGPAFGHKLLVTATPGPPLRVTASYSDGTPADGATAVVTGAGGAEAGRCTLDADGAGELPQPAGGWAVTVDDGVGHRGSVRSDRRGSGEGPARWLTLAAGLALVGGWVGWRRRAGR